MTCSTSADSQTIFFQLFASGENDLVNNGFAGLVNFRKSDEIVKVFSTVEYDNLYPPEAGEVRHPMVIRDYSQNPLVDYDEIVGVIALTSEEVSALNKGWYYLEAKWLSSDDNYSGGSRLRVQKSSLAVRRY